MWEIIKYNPPDRGVIVRSGYYDQPEYYSNRHGGSLAILAVVAALLILLLWNTLPSRTDSSRSATGPMESSVSRDLTSIRQVSAYELNLRRGPDDRSEVSYILPRGTKVTLLGETHTDPTGNVWLRVIVETRQGKQIGWVDERYVM